MPATPTLRGAFRTDLRARAAYAEGAGIYRIVPWAVACPANREDLVRLVEWSAGSGTPLIARGAGSGMGGDNVGDGVIVDLNRYAPRLLEIDADRRRALVSPNVTLEEINQQAARYALRLPPDPSSGAWATLGGMVSTNAGGPRTVRYGSLRSWVEGVEVVTADAEVGWTTRASEGPGRADGPPPRAFARFWDEAAPAIRDARPLIERQFPKTRKNSSGYALDAFLASGDLVDLFVGAEGTLGIISGIDLRLDAVPAARAAMLIALTNLDALDDAVTALARLEPSAIELLDRTFLDLVAEARPAAPLPEILPGTQAVLLVEFEQSDVAAARNVVADAVRSVQPWATRVVTALTADEELLLRNLRTAASPIIAGLSEHRRSMQVIEDGCVPPGRTGEYIRFVRRAAETRQLQVVMFGHAGDGNIHVNLLPDLRREGWLDRVASLQDEVMTEVIRLGGTVSGEHGAGRLRARYLDRQYGPEVLDLFRRTKTAFDPRGIFNPGVILPDAAPLLSRLKMGPDAASLPPDIGRALREIERTGGYGVSRLAIADAIPPSPAADTGGH